MKNLDEQIKNIYSSKSLSIEQIELIQQKALRNNRSVKKSIKYLFRYAAIFILILSSYFMFIYPKNQQNIVVNNFAKEIAFKHQLQVPSVFKGNDIKEINSQMGKLDFNLILPDKNTSKLELIGAKYCSVNNRIAAKLELVNKNNEIVTCYVFKKIEKFKFNNQVNNEDTKVTFWDNEDVVFALAQNQ